MSVKYPYITLLDDLYFERERERERERAIKSFRKEAMYVNLVWCSEFLLEDYCNPLYLLTNHFSLLLKHGECKHGRFM